MVDMAMRSRRNVAYETPRRERQSLYVWSHVRLKGSEISQARSESSTRIVITGTESRQATCYRHAAIPRLPSPEWETDAGPPTQKQGARELTNAGCELEDALNLAIPVARYDLVVIPEPARNKPTAMLDDIRAVLRQIEGSQ